MDIDIRSWTLGFWAGMIVQSFLCCGYIVMSKHTNHKKTQETIEFFAAIDSIHDKWWDNYRPIHYDTTTYKEFENQDEEEIMLSLTLSFAYDDTAHIRCPRNTKKWLYDYLRKLYVRFTSEKIIEPMNFNEFLLLVRQANVRDTIRWDALK
jgi:hypothetical protein